MELGALLAELRRRRKRGVARLERTVESARAALDKGDEGEALGEEIAFKRRVLLELMRADARSRVLTRDFEDALRAKIAAGQQPP